MYKRDFLKTRSKVIAGATLAPDALAGDPPIPRAHGPSDQLQLALQEKLRRRFAQPRLISRANHRKEDRVARPKGRFQKSRHRVGDQRATMENMGPPRSAYRCPPASSRGQLRSLCGYLHSNSELAARLALAVSDPSFKPNAIPG